MSTSCDLCPCPSDVVSDPGEDEGFETLLEEQQQ